MPIDLILFKLASYKDMHRSDFAKFRTGVAPLRIETGRYECIPEIERSCIFCKDSVGDEIHLLLECPLYNEIRSELIQYAQIANVNFNSLKELDKFVFLFNSPDMIHSCAKACFLILQRRFFFYLVDFMTNDCLLFKVKYQRFIFEYLLF